jgi:hypothetical protein
VPEAPPDGRPTDLAVILGHVRAPRHFNNIKNSQAQYQNKCSHIPSLLGMLMAYSTLFHKHILWTAIGLSFLVVLTPMAELGGVVIPGKQQLCKTYNHDNIIIRD